MRLDVTRIGRLDADAGASAVAGRAADVADREPADQGGEAPCWAHLVGGYDEGDDDGALPADTR